MMKVEIISRETIKPSSPTPPHLRSFKFSVLDQINAQAYVPYIFFYPIEGNEEKTNAAERSDQLKKSLSETLMRYYPLAGRIQDNFSIDCNDEGVDYLEAKVNSELSKFLKEPELEVLRQFLPSAGFDKIIQDNDVAQLAIQVNNFNCGGLAIGMLVLDKIVDGSSVGSFITDWASLAHGSTEAVRPIFIQDSLFPSRDISGYMPTMGVTEGKFTIRRFVFDGSTIAALKEKLINNTYSSRLKHPTRVQVVSSFIWQRFMAASKAKPDFSKKLFVAKHAINMRGRMIPPLPRNSIGNFTLSVSASSTVENESEFGDLVGRLSEAIGKVNDERVRELQGDHEGFFRILEDSKEWDQIYSADEVEFLHFISWCRFPHYEADFGWGKPSWLSPAIYPNSDFGFNFVIMIDNRIGNGIEAWLCLEEQVIAWLERDKNFLAFALPNPSALD